MKRAILAAAVGLAWGSGAAAQGRRPITLEEFLTVERPGEVAISPDAQWVVYTVTTTDLSANRRRSDLWLQPADGGRPARRISTDSLGGRSAQWSPDGQRIAFISSRGGTPQIWIHDVASGRQRQVTTLSTGADGARWSPGGRMLAFVSEVYPECGDDACNQRRARQDGERPSQARLYDQLLYRHWNTWEDGRRSHLFVVPAEGGPPRDLLVGKDYDTPVPPFGGAEQYAWSPDDREIAFTTKLGRDQAWTTNNDIYIVPVVGGEPTLVTAGMTGAEQNPAYSADGRYLAFLSQERAGFESDRWRLMVKDRRTGQVREIPRNWDFSILEYVWAPGGLDLFAISEKRQRHEALHIVFATGEVHEILTDRNPSGMTVGAGQPFPWLAFVDEAVDRTPDVHTWRVDHQSPPRQVSRLNADLLARVAMNPARPFGWVGAGGDSVFGLLLTPPDFDPGRRYPALILIHGGPQGAWLDAFGSRWAPQMFAAPGYVVAMLNPRGSTGFGQRFIDEISRDWGGKVYEDIMKGVDWVARLPYVDSTRMAAAGGSYGGYMVNWINGHTNRFKALVNHAGVFNLESMYGATEELWFTDWDLGGPYWANRQDYDRWSPHRFAQNFRTPTLVIHGALDYRVPDTEGMQMFTALQRQDVPSRFLHFPDEGHWILRPANQRVWWNTVHEWLARWLARPAS
ncbi:MAG TPA: S9 family peptidase [Gemmatimonadales bacterium]|nr:S9 family peptidase [Gemmatimonadales bacterium]